MRRLLIPFKGPENAKSRLASMLTPAERAAVARSMFKHVLDTACGTLGAEEVVVVTTSLEVEATCRGRCRVSVEQAGDLNSAIRSALTCLEVDERETILGIIHADLPRLHRDDIEQLLAVRPNEIAIAPDREWQGTNALAYHSRSGFQTMFGVGSFARHLRQVRVRGLEPVIVARYGLATDVDEPHQMSDVGSLAPRPALVAGGHRGPMADSTNRCGRSTG